MTDSTFDIQSMIEVARKLQRVVEAQAYDEIWKLLDKVTIPEGYKLGIDLCKHQGTGSNSFVTLTFPDGRIIRDDSDEADFWTYLDFEDSPMGAWQACLLKHLWHYLPLFWHGGYAQRDYIYEPEQMDVVFTDKSMDESDNKEEFDSTKYDVTPTIQDLGASSKGHCFEITLCAWSPFGGLYRHRDYVFIGRPGVFFITWQGTCLYKYLWALRY